MSPGHTQENQPHDAVRETAPASDGGAAPRARPAGPLARVARRWPTWTALALVVATFADGVPPLPLLATLLAVMPLCYIAFGVLRGELARRDTVVLQLLGVALFGALALLALSVDRTAGHYVMAAGWFAHAVWDFAHHRAGRVVPRAWSEWCCVVDLFGAAAIVLWV
ncbi:hypothetical protein [Streptomyces sp. NPDC015131]|uniref:hypothetical protein n=1 Tax=Streptomyces sp. NPDC015131 TaxID=3364941 RepID=UPI003702B1FC